MADHSWPSIDELKDIKKKVSTLSGRSEEEVRVVVSPYRICPLGAHIDHQGGTVTAMTINKGILLGFVPSIDTEVVLHSGQFKGEVRFRIGDIQHARATGEKNGNHHIDTLKLQEECNWGNYARGAVYALQSRGNSLTRGIIGYVCGSEGLDSSGLSSSAAVGVAYLLALESANNLPVSPTENIEYDRLIENEYFGLRNGILDQSAILLSKNGCLTCINCKTKEHRHISSKKMLKDHESEQQKSYKILLACSGLKHSLTKNPGYNHRVAECEEAARVLLKASGTENVVPRLCNVDTEIYETHKCKLDLALAKRAEHYFSENMRVMKGIDAWAASDMKEFGKLISASGLSSIQNYECGCDPLIQLYKILQKAPGVFGARFSGAGFRGCCIAFVVADLAAEAASFIKEEYLKVQPEFACQIDPKSAVLICETSDCARII